MTRPGRQVESPAHSSGAVSTLGPVRTSYSKICRLHAVRRWRCVTIADKHRALSVQVIAGVLG